METKTIKTCHGLMTLRFLNGALLPKDVEPSEVAASSSESRMLLTQPYETQAELLIAKMRAEMIAELDRIAEQSFKLSVL